MGIVLSFARQVVQFLTGDLSGRRKLDPIAVLLGDRRLPFRSVLAGSLLSAITTLHILGEVGSSLRLLRFATALGMTRPLPGCTRLGTPALMPPPRAPAGPARRSTPADGSLSTDASVRPSARKTNNRHFARLVRNWCGSISKFRHRYRIIRGYHPELLIREDLAQIDSVGRSKRRFRLRRLHRTARGGYSSILASFPWGKKAHPNPNSDGPDTSRSNDNDIGSLDPALATCENARCFGGGLPRHEDSCPRPSSRLESATKTQRPLHRRPGLDKVTGWTECTPSPNSLLL